MRIWHQSFTVLEELPPYTERIRAHGAKLLGQGNELVLHGQIAGTFPTNYPGGEVSQPLLFHLHGLQWMLAALQAEQEGFDAYLICTVPDPMLWEIRTLLDIPVVGYGESAFQLACRLGRKFGILSFIERMTPYFEEQVRLNGFSSRFAGVQPGAATFQDIVAGFANPGPAIDKIRADARELIRKGADAIVCGGMPLDILLASEGITRIDDVPVIDGLAASVTTAEQMVTLRRKAGMAPCRRGYHGAMAPRERVLQLLKFYGVDRHLGAFKAG